MLYTLSQLPNNGNQNTTHKSNYITENMSEINDIKELYKNVFLRFIEMIDQYQWKYPVQMARYKTVKYKRGSFRQEINNIFQPYNV